MRHARTSLLLTLALLVAMSGAATAQVDFGTYVAIGDSLTMGVSSNAITQSVQQSSYPALLARQARASGFQQPLVSDPGLPPMLALTALTMTSQGPSPVIGLAAGLGQPINAGYAGIYNNLGIDGVGIVDVLSLKGNIYNLQANFLKYATDAAAGKPAAKKYHAADLTLRDGATTVMQQAIANQPTFISIFIGNSDVLGAVATGVVVDGVTMTPVSVFQSQFRTLLQTLHTQLPNAEMLVITLPDSSKAPLVTAVKPYVVNPANGQHIPLIGEAGPLYENDFVLLTGSALIAQGIGIPQAAGGTGIPLPEGKVDATGLHAGVILRAGEAAAVSQRLATLNQIIAQEASAVGATVYHSQEFLGQALTTGFVVGGVTITGAFLTGGIVSLDGIHLTRLGYALFADTLIEFMNAQMGTELPRINLREFLFASAGATSVAAAAASLNVDAARGIVSTFAPDAATDTFSVHVRRSIRKHLPAVERVRLAYPLQR